MRGGDVGYEGDTLYLVMQYLDGETLASRLTRGPLTADDAVAVAMQIGEALQAAHRAGVVPLQGRRFSAVHLPP